MQELSRKEDIQARWIIREKADIGTPLGWVANVFLIIALFKIGDRWRHAFLFTFVGEILWLVESWRIKRVDMVALCVVFAAVALWNWIKWGRNGTVPGP